VTGNFAQCMLRVLSSAFLKRETSAQKPSSYKAYFELLSNVVLRVTSKCTILKMHI